MAESGIWKTIGQISAAAGVIAAVLAGWWKIESTIDTEVKASTAIIVKDIETNTVAIATEFLNDLKLRLHVTQLEIRSLEEDHKPVPERLRMSEELLKQRIIDMEKKWFTEEE